MKIDPLMACLIAKVDPVYLRFKDVDGSIIIKLEKVTYTLVVEVRVHIPRTITSSVRCLPWSLI